MAPIRRPSTLPALIKTHELAAEDIEQIEVSVSRSAFHTVMTNHDPSVHLETILALAAVYGEITFQHIHDPAIGKTRGCRPSGPGSYLHSPEARAGQHGAAVGHGLDRAHPSGEVLRQDLRYPLMTAAEIQQKFRDLVGLRLESRTVADLERQLQGIESMEHVAPLIRALELDS